MNFVHFFLFTFVCSLIRNWFTYRNSNKTLSIWMYVYLSLFAIFEWTRLSKSKQQKFAIIFVSTFLVLQLTWHLFLSSGSVGNTTLFFIYLIMYTPDWLGWPKTIRVEAAYAVYLFTCLPVFFEGMGFFLKTGYLWHPGQILDVKGKEKVCFWWFFFHVLNQVNWMLIILL